MDGTLVEAWAGLKSFKRKGGSDGQIPPRTDRRRIRTHGSRYFMGHVVMENRNGLAVGARVTHATGRAEREAALELLGGIPRRRRITRTTSSLRNLTVAPA